MRPLKIYYCYSDNLTMRISTGIAEITSIRQANNITATEKIYIWPVYGEGRVEPIRPIHQNLEGKVVYTKPIPKEPEMLIELITRSQLFHYTQTADARQYSILLPGSFFDAIA